MSRILRSVRGASMVETALLFACLTTGTAVGIRALGVHVRDAAEHAATALAPAPVVEHREARLVVVRDVGSKARHP